MKEQEPNTHTHTMTHSLRGGGGVKRVACSVLVFNTLRFIGPRSSLSERCRIFGDDEHQQQTVWEQVTSKSWGTRRGMSGTSRQEGVMNHGDFCRCEKTPLPGWRDGTHHGWHQEGRVLHAARQASKYVNAVGKGYGYLGCTQTSTGQRDDGRKARGFCFKRGLGHGMVTAVCVIGSSRIAGRESGVVITVRASTNRMIGCRRRQLEGGALLPARQCWIIV